MIELTDDDLGARAVAELRGVHKRYGRVLALRGVDLQLRPGELVALLGPNGAGKTTAVGILLGQRRPDAGTARLFGRDPTVPAARRLVGATPSWSAFPTTSRSWRWSTWSGPTIRARRRPASCWAASVWPTWPVARVGSPAASGAGWRWRSPSPGGHGWWS